MQRRVEPEWLDELPPTDPQAIGSRRDLQRINRIMGNARILARALALHRGGHSHQTLIELGAGDGSLLLQLVRSMPRGESRQIVLVDRTPSVTTETCRQFRELSCEVEIVTQDVFKWLSTAVAPLNSSIVANLFLHHFQDSDLRHLLQLITQRCHFFAACEPRRSQLSLAASRLIGLIGCNAVTRHDAVISVLAGFQGDDISRLWTNGANWSVTESGAPPFSHRFIAAKLPS